VFYTYLDELQTWFATHGFRRRRHAPTAAAPEPAGD
jgi:hypothetical protein